MLINTVVLFLSDALPTFLLMALLLANSHSPSLMSSITKSMVYGTILGVFVSIVLMKIVANASDYFEGNLYELILSFLLLVFYSTAMAYLFTLNGRFQRCNPTIALILISISVGINGASLFTYLYTFWSHTAANVLSLGIVLGTGISVCVAVILFYVAQWAYISWHFSAPVWLFICHIAGQMHQIVHYLEQIGWLQSGMPIWNTRQLLSERSEVGHFLTSFIGYKDSPSMLHLIVFVLAIGLGAAIYYWSKHNNFQSTPRKDTEVLS